MGRSSRRSRCRGRGRRLWVRRCSWPPGGAPPAACGGREAAEQWNLGGAGAPLRRLGFRAALRGGLVGGEGRGWFKGDGPGISGSGLGKEGRGDHGRRSGLAVPRRVAKGMKLTGGAGLAARGRGDAGGSELVREENWAAARQAGRARASAWRWAERGRKKGSGWAARESVARPRGADLRAARDAGRGERGRRWAALGHAGGKGRGGGLGRFGLLFSGFGWAGFWVPSLFYFYFFSLFLFQTTPKLI